LCRRLTIATRRLARRVSDEWAQTMFGRVDLGGSWVDLLPKTIAGIRAPVKAAIYASSMDPTGYSLGYVLGRHEDRTKPEFDIALPLPIEGELHELGRLEDQFIRCFEAAVSTASGSRMEVLGLYAAWGCLLSERRHQQLGALMGLACAISVPYVLEIPIDSYETLWAIRIWFANRFPHEAIRYRALPPRRSIQPHHNPKRIRRYWKHRVEVTQKEDASETSPLN
jgi:hypothetical protein